MTDEVKNPKCPECGNIYNPKLIQIERGIFNPKEGFIPQWHCDKCGSWVDLGVK